MTTKNGFFYGITKLFIKTWMKFEQNLADKIHSSGEINLIFRQNKFK